MQQRPPDHVPPRPEQPRPRAGWADLLLGGGTVVAMVLVALMAAQGPRPWSVAGTVLAALCAGAGAYGLRGAFH